MICVTYTGKRHNSVFIVIKGFLRTKSAGESFDMHLFGGNSMLVFCNKGRLLHANINHS